MAYFADRKAGLTGTDKRTRISIAKGYVSPYFTNASGKELLRGVVQADMVTGRDISYATAKTLRARLASVRKQVTGRGEPSQTYSAPVYSSKSGAVTTTSSSTVSKKMMIVGAVGIVALLLIMR